MFAWKPSSSAADLLPGAAVAPAEPEATSETSSVHINEKMICGSSRVVIILYSEKTALTDKPYVTSVVS